MIVPTSTGSSSTMPIEPTNAAQANIGMRRRFMPGARVDSTVVATEPAASSRPAARSA
ncbi:MAG: hypothetical protein MUE78_07630 [Ilumatobacteraceae bacterium]|nr:hypothetical protein [Ilumatobacteraceae bacterium]